MQNVILVIHILACLAMIGLVLVQKSEGGGLGIGGGGANSLMSGRGAAGAIVRTTIIIGGIFFATSIALTSIANRTKGPASGIERALQDTESTTVAPVSNPGDLFDPSIDLLGNESASPAPPAGTDLIDPSAMPTAPVEQPAPADSEPTETNPQ
jgi:preprotein translocase subunit SecG